jgi:hypothetical protein
MKVVAAYFDPATDLEIDEGPLQDKDVDILINRVLSISSGRGHPALELRREDGSSLSIATDGRVAYLVWTNSLGESMHSLGSEVGEGLVFDYFGSWSEAPAAHLVDLAAARRSVLTYLGTGIPDTEEVVFESD